MKPELVRGFCIHQPTNMPWTVCLAFYAEQQTGNVYAKILAVVISCCQEHWSFSFSPVFSLPMCSKGHLQTQNDFLSAQVLVKSYVSYLTQKRAHL